MDDDDDGDNDDDDDDDGDDDDDDDDFESFQLSKNCFPLMDNSSVLWHFADFRQNPFNNKNFL